MSRMAKLVAALFATLLLGFGAGEWFGPDEAAAVGFCPYEICYIDAEGVYTCRPSAAPSYCDFNQLGRCDTEDCEPQ